MSWTKQLVFWLIGLSIPALVGIVALDLIFGDWLYENKWSKAQSINIIRDRKVIYNTDQMYGKEMPEVIYTRDINGLRGPCSNPSMIDVLTIGGSTTDQRYIPDGMTYQDVLQGLLQEHLKKPVCISNAGVDGHSTFGHLASFNNWFPLIKALKPKYFLFYVGVNDAGFRDSPLAGYDERGINEGIRQLLHDKSAIYRLLRTVRDVYYRFRPDRAYAEHNDVADLSIENYVAKSRTEGVEELIAINAKLFRERLNALMTLTAQHGGIPICVSQPHLLARTIDGSYKGVNSAFKYKGTNYNGLDYDASLKALNNTMKEVCQSAGRYFIDIASKEFQASDFYDFVHMKPSGAKKLAGYLYEEFVEQGVDLRL